MHRHIRGTNRVLVKRNGFKWIKDNGDSQELSRSWWSEWNNNLKPWGCWITLDRTKGLLNAGVFNLYFLCSWPWVFCFCSCLSLLKDKEFVLYWGGKKTTKSCFQLHMLFFTTRKKAIKKQLKVIHCLMRQASDGNRGPARDMTYGTLWCSQFSFNL